MFIFKLGEFRLSENEEELKQELEKLRAENRALKRGGDLQLKVSAKGAVSLYGLRRFPATFYADEWEKILGMKDRILEFIRDNDAALQRKN
tara:strand:+ start:285 stop:557 length:273 start_codon:yes stop_codon:yes gene_type:complete